MQFELLHRDQLDASRMMNRELKSAIKGESPYGISTVVKRKKRTRKSLKRKGK